MRIERTHRERLACVVARQIRERRYERAYYLRRELEVEWAEVHSVIVKMGW